jgi:hypothetical protein
VAKKKKLLLLLKRLLLKRRLRWKLLPLKPLLLKLLRWKPLLLKLLPLKPLPLKPLLPSNTGSRNEKPAFWPVFFRLCFAAARAAYARKRSSRAMASTKRGNGWV